MNLQDKDFDKIDFFSRIIVTEIVSDTFISFVPKEGIMEYSAMMLDSNDKLNKFLLRDCRR